jgi:hypothetical protein
MNVNSAALVKWSIGGSIKIDRVSAESGQQAAELKNWKRSSINEVLGIGDAGKKEKERLWRGRGGGRLS